MARNFLGCDREQELLLPPSLRDWLPADHLAWFVIATVEQLDLAAIYADYRADGRGRPAHDPGMMVALLLYAYAIGERSSRRVERACEQDLAFRVICANRVPDHTTISRFRGRHQDALAGLFTEILRLCAEAGLVRVGEIALDGSKLAADASLRESRSYRAIRAEVEQMLEQAAAVDAEQDARYGVARGDELPAELVDPASRRARLEAAKRALEAEDAERQAAHDAIVAERAEHHKRTGKWPPGRPPVAPDPAVLERSKANVTDPDSRIVHHRGQLIQGYNPQVVATADQIVLAAAASNDEFDRHQLAPMLTATREQLTAAGITDPITSLLADGGYWNTTAITDIQDTGIEVLIPPQKRFTKAPTAIAMRRVLDSPEGKRRYRRRAQIVEPVFARIRHHRGITRFMRRGLAAVDAEWKLIAATHNLLKLHTANRTPAPA
jgi:transposase